MTLSIYNTLTREREVFQPENPEEVKMYVCGPTVYDYIHIGNARPLIVFDVVRRFLSRKYRVNFVLNFTDVDDKLIKKAEQSGETVPEVADRFITAYYEDAHALGIADATVHPRVTEHIQEIVDFISGLETQGFTYTVDGDVYFRTDLFEDYGKLSGQQLDALQHGIRVEVDQRKEHAHDFVLWKRAKPGEISWQSPWGAGRPGWHIECSAMAKKYLGTTIDIHGGGADLQFPHHECEVAQSEALHGGQALARYWMHNGYIRIDNEKMSKSLGNGVTVRELLQRYKPGALRYLMLSTHYRSPLNFSEQAMVQAEQSLARIENCVANIEHRLKDAKQEVASSETLQVIADAKKKFDDKLNDDFNTPDAVTVVFELVSDINHLLQQSQVSSGDLEAYLDTLNEWNEVLGLIVAQEKTEGLADAQIEQLIVERTAARKEKNFARSDEIRDQLAAEGILLEDTPQGMRWRRK